MISTRTAQNRKIMKKPISIQKSPLKLSREHIRLLTPTELKGAVGGEKPTETPTEKPTASNNCGGTYSVLAAECA